MSYRVILGICVFMLSYAQVVIGQTPKKYVKDAETYYKARKFADVIQSVSEALKLDSLNVDALILRAKAFNELGQLDKVVEDLKIVSTLQPKNQLVLNDYGMALIKIDRCKDAIAVFNQLISNQPKFQNAYHQKASCLLSNKEFEQTVQTSQMALSIDKSDDLAMYYMAVATDSLSNISLASTYYQKAIEFAKANKSKRNNPAILKPYMVGLSSTQLKLHNYEGAIKTIDEALQLEAGNASLLYMRGIAYSKRSMYQEALADFGQSIGIDGKNPLPYRERAKVQKKLGQFALATSDFTQAIVLNENDWESFYGRGDCYVSTNQFNDAVRDLKRASKMKPGNSEISKALIDARSKQYDANKETDEPKIVVLEPKIIEGLIRVKENELTLQIELQITDASPLKSIVIGGKSQAVVEDELNPQISYAFPLENKDKLEIQITDIYLNTSKISYPIQKQEVNKPVVKITKPYQTLENELFIENKPTIFIEGRVLDQSKIASIVINGTAASFPMDVKDPPFNAMVNVGTSDSLEVRVQDEHGNETIAIYKLIRDSDDGISAMGRTWVVFIENSDYKNLQKLDGPGRDINMMKAALNEYKVDKIIHRKNLSKSDLDRFFSLELRDLVQNNQVKSIIVWYAGHGKFLNETGYWIPIDADTYDEFTYYSVNSLRSSMQAYTEVKHVLVISDACESGPAFYMAMREELKPSICENWEPTKFKSAQVFTSSNRESSSDNSLFSQAFVNVLNNNKEDCISIETIAFKVTGIVKQNQKQSPKFGKIKGLDDENGSFYFLKKSF